MKVQYKYLLVIIGGLIVILTVVLAVAFSTDKTSKKEVNMDSIMNTIFNTVQEIVEEQNEMFETPVNEQFDIQENSQDITDNENIVRGEFTNIMGYDGYTIRDKSAVYPHQTCYYAVEGEEEFLIAQSWNFEDKEDDYIVDIDGDGMNELVCNCTWGDGGLIVIVFK